MAEVDAALATALKAAKGKKMFFAFVPKGSDGKLIVSKTKIPAKEIAEVKKELGGGNAITGKCFGPINNMVFLVAKPAPATLGPALKKVAKRDSGLTVIPEFQVVSDADAETEEKEDEDIGSAPGAAGAPKKEAAPSDDAAAPPAPPSTGPAAPAPAGKGAAAQANVLGLQKGLQKLGFDPGKLDGIMGPPTQGAIKKFQEAKGLKADGNLGPQTQAALARALQGGGGAAGGGAPAGAGAPAAGQAPSGGQAAPQKEIKPPAVDGSTKDPGSIDYGPWQAARQSAITDLKALAMKVASTKHASAAGVVKEIQFIIGKLPAKPTGNELDKLEDFVRSDDTITAAEEVPSHFHNLSIRDPLLQALQGLKK